MDRLDYHNEAYIVAGGTLNGKVMYLSFDDGEHCWETCAFCANLYNSLDEARMGMKVAQQTKHGGIQKIWLEKLSTSKVESEPEIKI